MKRLVLVLMALLLPLQLSWAAVGEYCPHESVPQGAQHFGHHEHVHKADGKHDAGKKLFDGDCSFCHAGVPAGLTSPAPRVPAVSVARVQVAPVEDTHPSALPRAPDRPQWPRLA